MTRSGYSTQRHVWKYGAVPIALALIAAAAVPCARGQDGMTLEDVVRSTLERNLAILESRQAVRMREAELRVVEGAFDLTFGLSAEGGRSSTLFSNSERSGYSASTAYTGVSSYRISAARRTRAGVIISPAFNLVRQDPLTLNAPPVIQTQAALELSYPILNAGRRSPEAADETAASHALEASVLEEAHTRAVSVYRAVLAFWTYVGAFEALEIQVDSEAKALRLLEETRSLVEGGERAASDLDQLRADLAERFGARLEAEQRLVEARQQVGMEMGLTAEESAALPSPSRNFPVANNRAAPGTEALEGLASARRADLAATTKSVTSAAEATYARRTEVRPRLDLQVSIGYAGLSEDQLTIGQHLPIFGRNHVRGTNGAVTLVLEWPLSNRRAQGRLQRQQSALRQAQIHQAVLGRQIRSNLRMAAGQLRSSIAELDKLDEAVRLYSASVENERTKLQLGMSTQFDLILVEERLRNSLLARVAGRVRFAAAVARVRFETGTLVSRDQDAERIALRLLSPLVERD